MCGRFTQDVTDDGLIDLYGLDREAAGVVTRSRWNGAPTQDFVICRADGAGKTSLARHRWGLIPAWARDIKIGARLINARSETVHSKPSFRSAFRRRRCLVPANGWFEWQREGTVKQPWWISFGGDLFSFAGLWETWNGGAGPVHSFTVLTCPSASALKWLHHRQPAIIPRECYGEWLEPRARVPSLLELARASHSGPFECRKVSRAVNRVGNDDPGILDPA